MDVVPVFELDVDILIAHLPRLDICDVVASENYQKFGRVKAPLVRKVCSSLSKLALIQIVPLKPQFDCLRTW
jgi:hypothetical protein